MDGIRLVRNLLSLSSFKSPVPFPFLCFQLMCCTFLIPQHPLLTSPLNSASLVAFISIHIDIHFLLVSIYLHIHLNIFISVHHHLSSDSWHCFLTVSLLVVFPNLSFTLETEEWPNYKVNHSSTQIFQGFSINLRIKSNHLNMICKALHYQAFCDKSKFISCHFSSHSMPYPNWIPLPVMFSLVYDTL